MQEGNKHYYLDYARPAPSFTYLIFLKEKYKARVLAVNEDLSKTHLGAELSLLTNLPTGHSGFKQAAPSLPGLQPPENGLKV